MEIPVIDGISIQISGRKMHQKCTIKYYNKSNDQTQKVWDKIV